MVLLCHLLAMLWYLPTGTLLQLKQLIDICERQFGTLHGALIHVVFRICNLLRVPLDQQLNYERMSREDWAVAHPS